ncbi:Gfo/Idh/MocA family protein [Ensifer sp. 4252]|uniref:Gfo/Idh/MocA family protein n=1 Tax=Ensifer sp. 4252 TaxID=3373915 RepID=UPI003D1CF630
MNVRVAAIGVSHWHALYDPAYLRQLQRMDGVEIAAIQDDDFGIAARRGAEVSCLRVYSDYKDMLAETRPDFVLALGRHDRMAAVAHHLLDNGYPFLMEKPMGLNATEVAGIAEKARELNGYAAIPMPLRLSPFFLKARELATEDRFGRLSHLYVRMNRFSSARYVAWDSPWMLDPEASGGGALRNLGTHGFDLFHALTGEEVEVIGAQISARALGEKVEDYASVLFRSESGVLGTLEVGNAFPRLTTEGIKAGGTDKLLDGADGEMKICGSDAMLTAKDGQLKLVSARSEEVMPGLPDGNPSHRILEEALSRWKSGQAPAVSVFDCLRAVKLADDAYRLAGAKK